MEIIIWTVVVFIVGTYAGKRRAQQARQRQADHDRLLARLRQA